ncbi:MAG TPA: CehA/McbA family metallohydrolase, partial [Candidatus Limnocylindrales bacterium]
MEDQVVNLLEVGGQWTHRDRHRHNQFPIEVPPRTTELRVRLQWGPRDLGSEGEPTVITLSQNILTLSVFGPNGYRGGAMRSRPDQTVSITASSASPGLVAGPIEPGAWTINVDAHEILNDGTSTGYLTYRIEASARVGDDVADSSPRPSPVATPRPPAGGPRWYRGNLHSHTIHSDGVYTVEERARASAEFGLDFLAITDHNTISQHRELGGWPDGLTPIRGSEVTTFHGHINCFGLSTAIDWRADDRGGGAAAIVEQAHRQGAIVSINHPSSFGDPYCSSCHWDYARTDYATFDAMEIWNGGWADVETANECTIAFWSTLLDAGFRLTGIAGTDAHSPKDDDDPSLGSTWVHAADPSEASIIDGIRRGRVFVSRGPTLAFRATGRDGAVVELPGAELAVDHTMRLSVDVDRLDEAATLWFVTSGSTVAIAACEPGAARVVDGRELAASRWWRLELRRGPAANG